jgi:cytochrome c-type biogenesis protein CcmH
MMWLMCLWLLITPAQAVEPGEMLADPALEARARTLSQQLRCMVCQNESIDTSQASFAHDMRVVIREKLAAGQSDRQILDYIHSRYGDYVLMRPPFDRQTYALWLGPGLILVGSAVGLGLLHRRRRFTEDDDDELDATE